jgi:2-dehydropantoate 2-reductase
VKITIVGAGAVGGYFGARWQEAGHDVTFLVREGRKAQLQQTGLVLKSPQGDAHLVPTLATRAEDIPECDLVLVGVKNYHLTGALSNIVKLAQKGAYVLPLLNGIEHFQVLQDACGTDRVLGGLVHIITTLNSEGHIIHTHRAHHITFGPLHESQVAFCERLMVESASANMVLVKSDNIMVDVWKKYAFITAFSGVTTASRLPIDEVVAYKPTAAIFRSALEEMSMLAQADGWSLPEDYVASQMAFIESMPKGATSSMHQDFRKGLPLEVERLQGAALRVAEQHGLDVPTLRTLYGLLLPYANGQIGVH